MSSSWREAARSLPGESDNLMTRAGARCRRTVRVVLASGALLGVGTASAVGGPTTILDSGPTELPPAGAASSTPKTGEIVVTYSGRPENSGSLGSVTAVNQVWIYGDGRVITRREGGPFGVRDAATRTIKTGYLERRLSPAGVARVRSAVAAGGLFDHDRRLRSGPDLSWGAIQLRRRHRLVTVAWQRSGWTGLPLPTVPSRRQERELARLTKRLTDLTSWLPASAWAARRLKSYVPSTYAICYWREDSVRPDRAFSALPVDARRFVRGKNRSFHPYGAQGERVICSRVTTRAARRLSEILFSAGFEPEPFRLNVPPPNTYDNVRFRATYPNDELFLSFEPILPHGQWMAMGG